MERADLVSTVAEYADVSAKAVERAFDEMIFSISSKRKPAGIALITGTFELRVRREGGHIATERGRRVAAGKAAPAKKAGAAKKAPAKSAAVAKKAPAKSAAVAKKAPAKSAAVAKKAPAKKAPAKKAPAAKAAARPGKAAGRR